MALNSTIVAFQLTMTGSAQQLPSNLLTKGGTLIAKSGNSAVIAIGNSSAVTTSTGALLGAGETVPISGITNTDAIYVIGTSSDVISFLGV
jgi:hypothetical protein